MLYDKRWDKPEVKADPFSLQSLIAWLETMPAAAEYCYADNGECLLGLYFSEGGFERALVGSSTLTHGRDCQHTRHLPRNFDAIAVGHPRTFGAALARARKALADAD